MFNCIHLDHWSVPSPLRNSDIKFTYNPTLIQRTGSVFLTREEARLLYGRNMGVGCEERRGWVRKRVGRERGSNCLFFKIKNFKYQLDNNISQKREKRSHLKLF